MYSVQREQRMHLFDAGYEQRFTEALESIANSLEKLSNCVESSAIEPDDKPISGLKITGLVLNRFSSIDREVIPKNE